MKLQDLLKLAIIELENGNIPNPALDARILLQNAAKIAPEDIYLKPEFEVSEEIAKHYWKLIERRKLHEPVAKIIGYKAFWNSDFIVNCHVLDPRPDSEVIIAAALELFPEKNTALKILDLGTGTGCLLLSLLQEFPNAKGVGIDLSAEALLVAKENVKLLSLQDRVQLFQQNWADGLSEKFDLIISNPPYIPASEIASLDETVKFYDPQMALNGGADGLLPYRYIAKQISSLLNPNSYAIFEFGDGQGDEIQAIFKAEHFTVERMLNDLSSTERAIIVSFKNNV